MCRFTYYVGKPIRLSSLITEPDNSLINQSFRAREHEEPLNGDGFGVAWYAPDMSDEPAAFRSLTPAWSNRNLIELARVVASPCILAHVRAATQELQVSESNCHPFIKGRHSFMHNGDVGGFRVIKRRLLDLLSDRAFHSIQGTTDSEHLFALFLDELDKQHVSEPADAMAGALRSAVFKTLELGREHAPGEHSYINVAVSDGRSGVACRFTTDDPEHAMTLYMNRGDRYVCEDGVCRMLDPEDGEGAVLISSERLSDDPKWTPVPVNHLVRIRSNLQVTVEPFMG